MWATVLTTELLATHRLLSEGRITERQAQALAEAVTRLTPEQIAELEQRVLPRAPHQSYAQFRRSLTLARGRVAPQTQEQSRAENMERRRVVIDHEANGMSTLWALLPTEGAQTVAAALRAIATRVGLDDERTFAQREADALVEIGARTLARDDQPRQHGLKPHNAVTMTLETLLGLSDQPAELDGVGPLPAAVARELAYDSTGTWRRMIVDPSPGAASTTGGRRTRRRPR